MVKTFKTLKDGDTVWKIGDGLTEICSTDIYKVDGEPSVSEEGLTIKLKLFEDGGCKEKYSEYMIPTSCMTMPFLDGFILNEKGVAPARGLWLTMVDIFNGNI